VDALSELFVLGLAAVQIAAKGDEVGNAQQRV